MHNIDVSNIKGQVTVSGASGPIGSISRRRIFSWAKMAAAAAVSAYFAEAHPVTVGSTGPEARRVLRAGGSLMSVGLDPHTALDQWWIYDYFPGALAADRAALAVSVPLPSSCAVSPSSSGSQSVALAEERGDAAARGGLDAARYLDGANFASRLPEPIR